MVLYVQVRGGGGMGGGNSELQCYRGGMVQKEIVKEKKQEKQAILFFVTNLVMTFF